MLELVQGCEMWEAWNRNGHGNDEGEGEEGVGWKGIRVDVSTFERSRGEKVFFFGETDLFF